MSLILRAQQPMFISWGPRYISLYNDGYIPILGDKHPDALGHSMAEVWSEIWDELRLLNEAVMRGESLSFENRPFQLAGRATPGPHYFSFTYTPLLDDDGRVAGIFCAAIETTSTVTLADNARAASAAQQALAESEERLRLAADAAEIAFWDVNVPVGSLILQPRLRAMFGITTDEALSLDDFFAVLHPEDRETVARAFAAACDPQRRELYNIEYRAVGRDDGRVRWIAAKGRGLFDAAGRCVRANGTAVDITARKTTELAMEMALEASRTGTFHWDIQDNRLTWDGALDRLFGLRPGEAVRSLDQFIALVHPDDRAEVIRRCERCRDAGDDFEMEFRVVYPDGSVHWLYDRGRTF
ncbi:MAG: PAS domain-containing protein, partial [Xanthobacteraceae bacterium]